MLKLGFVLAVSQFLLIDVLSVLAFSTNGHLIPPKSSFRDVVIQMLFLAQECGLPLSHDSPPLILWLCSYAISQQRINGSSPESSEWPYEYVVGSVYPLGAILCTRAAVASNLTFNKNRTCWSKSKKLSITYNQLINCIH